MTRTRVHRPCVNAIMSIKLKCESCIGQTFSLGSMCGPGETCSEFIDFCLPRNLVSVSSPFWKTFCIDLQLFTTSSSIKGTLFPLCRKDFNKCLRHFLPKLKMQAQNAYVRPYFENEIVNSLLAT
jgi:hypothetical protein